MPTPWIYIPPSLRTASASFLNDLSGIVLGVGVGVGVDVSVAVAVAVGVGVGGGTGFGFGAGVGIGVGVDVGAVFSINSSASTSTGLWISGRDWYSAATDEMEGGNAEKDEAGNALWDNDLEARNCFASFLAGGVGIDGWMFGVDGDESESIPICCSIGKAMAAGCSVGTYVSSAVAGTDRAVGSSPMLIPVEAM